MVVVKDHRVQDVTPTYFYYPKKHLGGTAAFETRCKSFPLKSNDKHYYKHPFLPVIKQPRSIKST